MKKIIAVAAAAIIRDQRLLVACRPLGKRFAACWELPGGKLEAGESPAVACAREIDEELGVKITVASEVFTLEHDYDDFVVRLHVLRCSLPEGQVLQLREHLGIYFATAAELTGLNWVPADQELVPRLAALLS